MRFVRFFLLIIPAFSLLALAGCDKDEELFVADFILPDVDGNNVQLSKQKGKAVLRHFFATWCQICQAEVTEMNAIRTRYSTDDVAILAIAVDSGSPEGIRGFIENFGVTYPVLLDDNRVSRAYGVLQTIPMTYIINHERASVAALYEGYVPRGELIRIIDRLLQ